MNFIQELDLKNGCIRCNFCERYLSKGVHTIWSDKWVVSICLSCRKRLKELLK